MIALDAPVFAPDIALEEVAKRSVDWWLTSEDFRILIIVRVKGDSSYYTDNNTEAFDRLLTRWTEVLKSINCGDRFCRVHSIWKRILQGVAHQVYLSVWQ